MQKDISVCPCIKDMFPKQDAFLQNPLNLLNSDPFSPECISWVPQTQRPTHPARLKAAIQ
jgi:hypothetical protein